jgi:hypothetical protein
MKKIGSKKDEAPAQLIDARIEEPADWRGAMLSRLRALIKQADPEMIEEGNGGSRRMRWRGSRCGRTTGSSAPARRTRPS